MSLRFTQRIEDHLAYDSYRPADIAEVRRQMRVPQEDADEFARAVEQMASEGRIEVGGDGKLRLPRYADEIEG